tara:strand:- start:2227 stop:3015 length:789 start_codon:yes stop_codon:yes gene_type:complete
MKLTLIITTYNNPEFLLLVLTSIENQTLHPFEVIIADDGSNDKTKDLISSYKLKSSLTIYHSWQEDNGFRAARSRNLAISKSTGDYIVLIDGDVILHPCFIEDHFRRAEPGYFVQGSRVLLSKKQTRISLSRHKIDFSFFSRGILNRKNSIHSKLLAMIFSNKKYHFKGIKSCNMGFFKIDCINVNGFNNEFEGWGREDSEFIVRLMNNGLNRKNIRFCAIQFHLWHKENSRNLLSQNDIVLKCAINSNLKWCDNGINRISK